MQTHFFQYQSSKSAANVAIAAWSSINGNSGLIQTQQQKYYSQFKGYWKNRTLFTIQTPWEILPNMAILNMTAVQSEETRMITDFDITFKQINFAQLAKSLPQGQTSLTESQKNLLDPNNKAGRLSSQAATPVDLGTSTPTQSISLTSVLPEGLLGGVSL